MEHFRADFWAAARLAHKAFSAFERQKQRLEVQKMPSHVPKTAVAVILWLLASCTSDPQLKPAEIVVIDHVTVLDGRGGTAVPDAQVVVQHGKIAEISRSARTFPTNAVVIDGRGKFLLPGFIDMHAHLLFPRCTHDDNAPRFDRALSERALSRYIDFGITTVRSPATPTIDGLKLRDDLNAGAIRGPRAFASAELMNDASLTESQLRQAVQGALVYRPDYFKVYARMRPEQIAAVIHEAHQQHIPVIGHLQRTSWSEGVRLGIDHLSHSVDWSVDSLPVPARRDYLDAQKARGGFRSRIDWLEAFDPESAAQQHLIAELALKRVSVDVTLIAYDGKFSPPDSAKYRRNKYLRTFPELRDDWERCADVTAGWTADDYRRWKAARPKLLAWIKKLSDGNVLLVTGTDLTNEWVIPGVGLHQEFELLAEAGLSPSQILRMTGANAAEALRRDDIGVVEVGRRADLILLAADPRRHIGNTKSILWVMQSGRIVANRLGSP